jgi:hypothetical protein
VAASKRAAYSPADTWYSGNVSPWTHIPRRASLRYLIPRQSLCHAPLQLGRRLNGSVTGAGSALQMVAVTGPPMMPTPVITPALLPESVAAASACRYFPCQRCDTAEVLRFIRRQPDGASTGERRTRCLGDRCHLDVLAEGLDSPSPQAPAGGSEVACKSASRNPGKISLRSSLRKAFIWDVPR